MRRSSSPTNRPRLRRRRRRTRRCCRRRPSPSGGNRRRERGRHRTDLHVVAAGGCPDHQEPCHESGAIRLQHLYSLRKCPDIPQDVRRTLGTTAPDDNPARDCSQSARCMDGSRNTHRATTEDPASHRRRETHTARPTMCISSAGRLQLPYLGLADLITTLAGPDRGTCSCHPVTSPSTSDAVQGKWKIPSKPTPDREHLALPARTLREARQWSPPTQRPPIPVRLGRGASPPLRVSPQQWVRDGVMRSSASRLGVADRLAYPAGDSVPAGSPRRRTPWPRQPTPARPRRRAQGRARCNSDRPWRDACDRAQERAFRRCSRAFLRRCWSACW